MNKYFNILLLSLSLYLVLCSRVESAEPMGSMLSLSQAVQIAVENNSVVREAVENKKSALFESHSAKADRFPKVSVNYSYTGLAEDPFIKIADGPEAQIAHSNQYHWGVTLVQPLFSGFALSTRYEITKLGVDIKDKEKQQAILDVTQGAKNAYFSILLTRKLLFVADDTIKSLRSHARDAQRYYDRGVIRLNDLLRAKVALSNAIQNRERIQAATKMAVSDLNRWLAFDINRDTRIKDIETVFPKEYRLEELIQIGMKNRPLLQVLRISLEAFDKKIRLEKSGYFPTVALVGGYERDGDDPSASSNDFSNEHNAFVALAARWTFFDSFRTRAKVSKAKSDKRAFLETIRSTEDGIKLEIKDAYLDLKVAENNIETSKVSLTQAEENLRITRLGYRQQAVTSTEVLDAQADLTLAQTSYYQALYGYLNALASLERSIGFRLEG
jgi:outer membrane protein